jgi:hypothetical protein
VAAHAAARAAATREVAAREASVAHEVVSCAAATCEAAALAVAVLEAAAREVRAAAARAARTWLFSGRCGTSGREPTPGLHVSGVQGCVLLSMMRMLRRRKNRMVNLLNQNFTLGEPNSTTMPKCSMQQAFPWLHLPILLYNELVMVIILVFPVCPSSCEEV